ncbi:unannotated protein [freshwater metagenome]|jgi:hypothetical protein|uniref:Unannotated protein n=1 Tax=freshwater metagenome TaxID=449393 RepID=A0A6J7J2I6_9ZZZZ|nr:DUF3145 family protein [Actinomycetota bacterium]MSV63468.1 DUF3145 family protein [Actinomycetota bacterium]MSW26918.1 DUF3145 family protein [Actinomycetota bacterium]MSW33583.1 DUF3145 family protein [Actinomycetota bacterium]MSX31122.1 DUF3145 family protein [Actinomycetota bacterium]
MDRFNAPLGKGPITLSRGSLVIHSAPSSLMRHVEWAVQNLLGASITLEWIAQPLLAGTYRAIVQWRDCEGLGAQLASALRGWHYLRFEIREESVYESVLYRFTPTLGIHRAVLDGAGSVMVTENQITSALVMNEDALRLSLESTIGSAWDLELEQFRQVELDDLPHSEAI